MDSVTVTVIDTVTDMGLNTVTVRVRFTMAKVIQNPLWMKPSVNHDPTLI